MNIKSDSSSPSQPPMTRARPVIVPAGNSQRWPRMAVHWPMAAAARVSSILQHPRISSALGILVPLQPQVKGPKPPCRINMVSGFRCPCKCCTVFLCLLDDTAMTSRLELIATRVSRVCLRGRGSLRVTSPRSGKATMQFFKCIHAVVA